MAEWICETCKHYPPSSCDGKPCSFCNPDDWRMNCYDKREDEEYEENISESRKYIREEVMKQMD